MNLIARLPNAGAKSHIPKLISLVRNRHVQNKNSIKPSPRKVRKTNPSKRIALLQLLSIWLEKASSESNQTAKFLTTGCLSSWNACKLQLKWYGFFNPTEGYYLIFISIRNPTEILMDICHDETFHWTHFLNILTFDSMQAENATKEK